MKYIDMILFTSFHVFFKELYFVVIVQAMTLGVNPLYFMFPTAIATSFAFMLPVATPPNAVVFSYGFVKVFDMVRNGISI